MRGPAGRVHVCTSMCKHVKEAVGTPPPPFICGAGALQGAPPHLCAPSQGHPRVSQEEDPKIWTPWAWGAGGAGWGSVSWRVTAGLGNGAFNGALGHAERALREMQGASGES